MIGARPVSPGLDGRHSRALWSLLLFLTVCQPCRAQRWAIRCGGAIATVDDSTTLLLNIQPEPDLTPVNGPPSSPTAGNGGILSSGPSGSFRPFPEDLLTRDFDPISPTAQGLDPIRQPESSVPVDELLDRAITDPSASFIDRLATIYGVTDPAKIDAVWRFYIVEPTSIGNSTSGITPLGDNERVGNAVIRYILATDDPLEGSSPRSLDPLATQGVVQSTVGLQLRTAPWGAAQGALSDGAAVTLIPPSEGSWYHVDTGQGSAWVTGIWLKLQ